MLVDQEKYLFGNHDLNQCYSRTLFDMYYSICFLAFKVFESRKWAIQCFQLAIVYSCAAATNADLWKC